MMKTRLMILLAVFVVLFATVPLLAQDETLPVESAEVEVMSGGQAYQSYLAATAEEGIHPGIVLIHSFNGLEQGYKDMVDRFAAEGFVVLAIGWQTFEQSPTDDAMTQILTDAVAFLTARDDVDASRLGLTG